MSEKRQLAILVIVTLAIGVAAVLIGLMVGFLMEGDLVVENYEATFQSDGSLTEEFTYVVKSSGKYRMLYRYWEADLSLSPLQSPYIEFEDISYPSGVVGYVKDYRGNVIFRDGKNPEYEDFIKRKAENNEVGIYNPGYFQAGTYTVTYRYKLHPPIEYDDEFAHVNIKLLEEHGPYRDLSITYPAAHVREIYPHPPGLHIDRSGDTCIVTGSIQGNEILGLELLLSKDAINELQGFPEFVPEVAEKTRAANPWYDVIPLYASWILYLLGLIMVLLMPFLFLAIYHKYGREKPFVVPEYLSFIPDESMKPWQVNLLFKGDAVVFDEDGYYATLLAMHRKNILEIIEKQDGEGVTIRVIGDHSDDPYEERVLEFLREVGDDGIVDSEELASLAKQARKDKSIESRMLRYKEALSNVTHRSDPRLIADYIVDGRDNILPLAFVAASFCIISVMMIIIFSTLVALLVPATIFWADMILQSIIAFVFPATLFGHWKGDTYREKLEWDAFAKFLSDLALMKKYAPSDMSMWGEWLVYGTALGVGDKVVKAMDELDISIPEAALAVGVTSAFVPVLAFSPPSSGGGGGFGGGGSFGGGGGFGGGGAGGR